MRKNYFILKRLLDGISAVLLLVMLSPLFLLIAVLYWISAQTPLLFTQQRIGMNERIFTLYKFRTLKNENASLAQRKFWLGNLMRTTSLDELPQIINVLKGDMSFVGPRPLPEEYLPLFSDLQRKRHHVLPGITGLAQVNGRNTLPWEEKFKFDIYYVNNISFMLDFTILLKTVVLIFSFRKDVSLDEKRFTGTPHA